MEEILAEWKDRGQMSWFVRLIALFSTEVAEVFNRPSAIYVHLYTLEEEGLVVSRVANISPAIGADGKALHRLEYKLVDEGKRARTPRTVISGPRQLITQLT